METTGRALAAAVEASPETMDIVRLVHGALMLVSFALLVPIGIAYGMYKVRLSYIAVSSSLSTASNVPMRQESLLVNPLESVMFRRHRAVFMLAIALQIVAVVLIVVFTSDHLKSLHAKLGVAVMGASVLQTALGVFRPNKFTRPRWWVLLHRRLLPVAVLGGGLAAIVLGTMRKLELDGVQTESVNDLLHFEWLVVIIVSGIGLAIVIWSFVRAKLRKTE